MSPAAPRTVQVIDTEGAGLALPLVEGRGEARVLLWPGNGARYRTLQVLRLGPAARTVALSHGQDCVWYVIRGGGEVRDLATGAAQEITEGAILHIDAGDRYRIEAGDGGAELIGGPVPADPALYAGLAAPAVRAAP
jgi:mannose-6-phosphate isomerase-like protein (cupin superfamily)